MLRSNLDFDTLKNGLTKQAQHIGVLRSLSLVPDTKNDMIICRVEPVDGRQQDQFAHFFKGSKIGAGVYFHIPYRFSPLGMRDCSPAS